ncbi:MAG: amidohydrolase family protein, partial [Gimesia sp.]
MERQILKARWVFPVDGPPLEGAVVEVEGSQIAAVYAGDHPRATDLGNTALIPGLVNAHTHLEFSDLEKPLTPVSPFTEWIRSVMKSRFESAGSAESKIQQGIKESLAAGTTCLGEIATSTESLQLLEQGQPVPRTVVFRECLGFSADQISGQEQIAADFLKQRTDHNHNNVLHLGLSPHAPYSVHPDLYSSLIHLARDEDAPVAVHLGET